MMLKFEEKDLKLLAGYLHDSGFDWDGVAFDPESRTLAITLNRPYAPLLAHLALPNGFAAIMPKETIATPLTEYIGTGPYKFKERKPDQYVLMVRFDGYSARKEPANGYAGKREALLDELRFVPVPNANTPLLNTVPLFVLP